MTKKTAARTSVRLARAGGIVLVAMLAAVFPAAAQDFGFGDGTNVASASTPNVTVGGSVGYTARVAPDFSDIKTSSVDSVPQANLSFSVSGKSISAYAVLKIDPDTLANNPAETLSQAWASAHLGNLEIKGGLQRISWGVADSLRVLDVLSPIDYRSLTFSDIEERYLPQASLSAKLSFGTSSSLQAVWTPFFEADQYAYSGKWEPKKIKSLMGTAYSNFYQLALASNGNNVELAKEYATAKTASFLSYPDTTSLKYSQAGLRFVTSLAGVDLGAQYWYGFDRRPSYDIATAQTTGQADISYDRLNHFGADAAFALGGFNFRLEGAANLTSDLKGDDPLVHNSNVAWSAGIDKDILGTTINLQGMQTYLLGADNITSATDIEYGDDDRSSTVALSLDHSFDRDRVKAQLAGMWEIEQEDYMLSPSLTFVLSDDLDLRVAGRLFLGDSSGNLGQYADNSYAEIGMSYSF